VLTFGLYFAIALVTGTLTARLRTQERSVRRNEEMSTAMYTLTREVASAGTMDAVLRTSIDQISHAFNADVAILLSTVEGRLSKESHPASTLALSDKEYGVAVWAFEKGAPAGRFTSTLGLAEAQHLPLQARGGGVGVLSVRTHDAHRLSMDQQTLLETFARQTALAIERERLDEEAEHARVVLQSEQLYRTLLDSVSHELRTPIAAISGAASALADPKTGANGAARESLLNEIRQGAERLNRVVENLLDMTRLESGRLSLNLDWCDVADVINVAVNHVQADLARHELILDIAPDLPLMRVDFVLLQQVIVNLLHNAAAYTPPKTRVRVGAHIDGDDLLIIVADRGPGLPKDEPQRVFDKFYRAPGAVPGGTGLGLSIAKGLVEAQGGRISAENRANGGARFIIRLPIQPTPSMPSEHIEPVEAISTSAQGGEHG
jgi:two-component system sensor histidine kinase KdpD